MRSLGIYKDIKLGGWAHVAPANGPTHDSNPFNFRQNFGESFDKYSQICHSASYNKLNLLLIFHDNVINLPHHIFINSLLIRNFKISSFEACLSVYINGSL